MLRFVYCMLLLFVMASHAAGNIETFLPKGENSIVIKAEYLEDINSELTVEVVRANTAGLDWQVVLEDYANFGYRPNPYWYRFEVSNPSSKGVSQIIELSYPLLDEVDFYRFDSSGELLENIRAGDRVPYSARRVDHPNFLYPIQLDAGEVQSFILRVKTAGSQLVPLRLWDNIELFSSLSRQDELHAVYFGIVLVIVFLNSLIFIALREKMYLYYAASTFSFMLLFAVLRGKLYPYVLSSSPAFHHLLLLFLPPLCLLFSALFTRHFLNVKDYSRGLNWIINLIVLVSVLCMLGIFFLDRQLSLQVSVLAAIPCTFMLLIFGPVLSWMGNRIAWVYTLAWGMLMSGATVTALSKGGYIPANFATEYGMQIGSAVEIFILTAALVYRFYLEHKNRLEAQAISIQESAERRDVQLKLLDSSMTHPVTMMPNRVCFEQTISQSIRGQRKRLSICMIESRRYTEICKTLGQQNADLLVCDLAQRYNREFAKLPGVISIVGPSFDASICSLEGGAFGALFDRDEAEAGSDQFSEILKAFREPVTYKDMLLDLDTSVGVAYYPEHGLNALTLMRHAEVAADQPEYVVSFYRPEQDQYNARRLTMISDLKEAIERDKLTLYLQPKFNLNTRKVVGVEALVRWKHEQYGMIRPDEFIPMAEQTGIIKLLTRWVFKEAVRLHIALKEQGYDLSMAINVSAMNLKEKDLLSFLKGQLSEYPIEPEKFYLEVTETSMMANPKAAMSTLAKIRQMGLKVSVDDFGAGYSSLSYLKDLPANEIKIDKSLAQSVSDNERGESVVKTAVKMCHELGFDVVAEGVETQEMLDHLAALECDLVQGYLLTPPLPINRLVEWLEEQNTTGRFAF